MLNTLNNGVKFTDLSLPQKCCAGAVVAVGLTRFLLDTDYKITLAVTVAAVAGSCFLHNYQGLFDKYVRLIEIKPNSSLKLAEKIETIDLEGLKSKIAREFAEVWNQFGSFASDEEKKHLDSVSLVLGLEDFEIESSMINDHKKIACVVLRKKFKDNPGANLYINQYEIKLSEWSEECSKAERRVGM